MMLLALMMICASAAAWILAGASVPDVRSYIRLAAIACAALGIASALNASLAHMVALIVMAIGPACLALAILGTRTLPLSVAALILAAAAWSGIAAAAMNMMALALAPLIVSVAAIAVCAIRAWKIAASRAAQALASALTFLAGASVYVKDDLIGQMALLLFMSAGLLGIALSLARDSDAAIEQQRVRDLSGRAIG